MRIRAKMNVKGINKGRSEGISWEGFYERNEVTTRAVLAVAYW